MMQLHTLEITIVEVAACSVVRCLNGKIVDRS